VKWKLPDLGLSRIAWSIVIVAALQGCGSGTKAASHALAPYDPSCVQAAFKTTGTPLFALYSPQLVHNLRVAELEPINSSLNITVVVLASPLLANRLLKEASGPDRSRVTRTGNVVVFFGHDESAKAKVQLAFTRLQRC
jgi:hypothetical protein